jgi:4-carboxymuconolactone decarboxylase
VKHRKPLDGIPDAEATVIALGREMIGNRKVSPETYARALKLFGPRMLVDVVSLMGNYVATALLLIAFDAQLPEGQEPPLPPG